MIAKVSKEECIGCSACTGSCNYDAITVEDYAVIDEEKCIGCGNCISYCVYGAISLVDK